MEELCKKPAQRLTGSFRAFPEEQEGVSRTTYVNNTDEKFWFGPYFVEETCSLDIARGVGFSAFSFHTPHQLR